MGRRRVFVVLVGIGLVMLAGIHWFAWEMGPADRQGPWRTGDVQAGQGGSESPARGQTDAVVNELEAKWRSWDVFGFFGTYWRVMRRGLEEGRRLPPGHQTGAGATAG